MNTLLCVLFIPLSSPRTVARDDLLSHGCGSPEDALLHEKRFASHTWRNQQKLPFVRRFSKELRRLSGTLPKSFCCEDYSNKVMS